MESPARVIASQAIPARGGRYPRNSLEPGSAKLNCGPWIAVPNPASGTMDFSALCELGPRPIAVCLRRSRVCMTEQHQEPPKDVTYSHQSSCGGCQGSSAHVPSCIRGTDRSPGGFGAISRFNGTLVNNLGAIRTLRVRSGEGR
jgi:hypothetical protein